MDIESLIYISEKNSCRGWLVNLCWLSDLVWQKISKDKQRPICIILYVRSLGSSCNLPSSLTFLGFIFSWADSFQIICLTPTWRFWFRNNTLQTGSRRRALEETSVMLCKVVGLIYWTWCLPLVYLSILSMLEHMNFSTFALYFTKFSTKKLLKYTFCPFVSHFPKNKTKSLKSRNRSS